MSNICATRTAALIGLLAASAVCQAETLLGVEGVGSKYKYNDVSSTAGYKLFADYRFDSLPIVAGFGYLDSGRHQIDSTGGDGIGFSGVDASVGFSMPFDFLRGVRPMLRAGYFKGDAKGHPAGRSTDFTSSSSGLSYSLSADWPAWRGIGVRIEFEQLLRVKDFQSGTDSKSALTLLSFGVFFGAPDTEGAPTARAETPAPSAPTSAAVEVPAPAQTSPPPSPLTPAPAPPELVAPPAPSALPPAATPMPTQPAPASVVALAAPAAAPVSAVREGTEVTLSKTLSLHPRPTDPSITNGSLPAGTLTKLVSQVVGPTGIWWYVTGKDSRGWVTSTELQRAQ